MTGMNKTVLAIIIFILLLGAVLLTQNDPYEQKKDTEIPKVPVVDKDAVDKVEIINTTEALTFEKKSAGWFITKPKEYRTEDTFGLMVVDKIAKVEIDRIVSNNVNKHSTFEVDEKGTRLKAYSNGNELISLIVGKNTPDYRGTFFRFPDSNTVYASKGMLGGSLKRKIIDWRFKKVLDFTRIDVDKFTLNLDKKPATFTLTSVTINENPKMGEAGSEDRWLLEGNKDFVTDEAKITTFLNTITNMTWAEIVDEAENMADYDLEAPKQWIELTTKDKKVFKLNLGKINEGKNLASISLDGVNKVFQIRKFQYDKLVNKMEYYKKAE